MSTGWTDPTLEVKRSSKPQATAGTTNTPSVVVPPDVTPEELRSMEEINQAASKAVLPSSSVGTVKEPPVQMLTEDRPAVPENTETKEEAPLVVCPHCSRLLSEKPTQLSTEDKRGYLKAILTGNPFSKTYPLFGGAILVTFRTRDAAVDDMIQTQLQREIKDGRFNGSTASWDLVYYRQRLNDLWLTASIEKITPMSPEVLPIPTHPDAASRWPATATDTVIGVMEKQLLRTMNVALLNAILYQFNQFNSLMAAAITNASNPDFWTGIANSD